MPRWLSATWCCITAGSVVAVALRYAKVLRAEGLESGREKKAFVFNRENERNQNKEKKLGVGGWGKGCGRECNQCVPHVPWCVR